MTIDKVKKMIENHSLCESEEIELKRDFPKDLSLLAKYCVSFANAQGGYIVVGVDDEMNVVGVKNKSNPRLLLQQMLNDYTTNVSAKVYSTNLNKHRVVIIQIESSDSEAYFCRHKTSPERMISYVREGDILRAIDRKLYKTVFKYMTLESFISSLYNRSLRFFEPNKWQDKFERRFYCANYKLPRASVCTPKLFATCVTRAKNSEAAWKVYSCGEGLGSKCVQLEINISALRKEICISGLRFDEKAVTYMSDNYIMNLHKKRALDYQKYFGDFNFEKFLGLLSLKREAYRYEQEVRLFVCPDMHEKRSKGRHAGYYDVPINWDKVIEKVRIDESCTDAELVALQQACRFAGVEPVMNSYNFIGAIDRPTNCTDVSFERFNIHSMPGRQRIIIK